MFNSLYFKRTHYFSDKFPQFHDMTINEMKCNESNEYLFDEIRYEAMILLHMFGLHE